MVKKKVVLVKQVTHVFGRKKNIICLRTWSQADFAPKPELLMYAGG